MCLRLVLNCRLEAACTMQGARQLAGSAWSKGKLTPEGPSWDVCGETLINRSQEKNLCSNAGLRVIKPQV